MVLTNADFIMFELGIESKIWGLDIKNIVVWIAKIRVQLLISGTLLSLPEKARTISEPGRSDVVVVCLFVQKYVCSFQESQQGCTCVSAGKNSLLPCKTHPSSYTFAGETIHHSPSKCFVLSSVKESDEWQVILNFFGTS